MKKFITFWVMTMLLAFTIPTVAQDTAKVQTVISDQLVTTTADLVTNTNAEKLVDKYLDKATAAITSLAQTLKTPAEHVYSVLVRNNQIKSWFSFGILLFFLLIDIILAIIPSINYIRVKKRNKNEDFFDDDVRGTLMIISIALFIILSISIILCGGDVANGILNPEYGAIKEIMRMF